jgi:hypothetical protein
MPGGTETSFPWLAQNLLLVGLLAAVVLAVLTEMPWLSPSARTAVLQGTVIVFLPLLALSGSLRDDRAALRRGPNPLLLALLAWTVFCAATAPYRGFAAANSCA